MPEEKKEEKAKPKSTAKKTTVKKPAPKKAAAPKKVVATKKTTAEKPAVKAKKVKAAPKVEKKVSSAKEKKVTPVEAVAAKPVAKKKPKTIIAKKIFDYKLPYAVIRTGGNQYRVQKDCWIDVEKLSADKGEIVEFSEVLFVGDAGKVKMGAPFVGGAVVKGEVIGDTAGPKLTSIKYRPRQRNCKRFGHRQHYSRVRITEVKI